MIVGFGGLVLICCLCLLRGCCLNGCCCVTWLLGMLVVLGGYVCDRWVSVCEFVVAFSVLFPLYWRRFNSVVLIVFMWFVAWWLGWWWFVCLSCLIVCRFWFLILWLV